jgi:CDP-diacylglycerol---glycerol-3-phosphate 3-phosphatidyltransferase
LGPPSAVAWGVPTAMVLAWFLFRLRRTLDLNHPPGDPELRPALGAANWLTIVRAGLAAPLAGFLCQTPVAAAGAAWDWLPGLFYLAASGLDQVDGYVARRTGGVTRLGEVLDTRVDALGLLLASLLLVAGAKAPLPYLWVGIGYYALQAAIQLRRAAGRPVGRVDARPDARWLAGCEMAFAALALLPVFTPEATRPAGWVMALALAVSLGLDWRIVCGHAAQDGSAAAAARNSFWGRLARGLPLALRFALAVGLATAFYTPPGDALDRLPWPLAAIAHLCAALCILGVAARAAAMLLSVVCALWLVPFLPGGPASVTLMAALALVLTGAGRPRLWQPEDAFLMRRRGARTAPAAPARQEAH